MSNLIQVRRGTSTQRLAMTLANGEPGWDTDTKTLWIGDGVTPGGIPVTSLQLSFKNKLINGNFDWWQRGTSLAAATGKRYIADRWATAGTGTTMAPSLQAFTLGQTAVPYEPAQFHRCVVASVAGVGNAAQMSQYIEGVRTFAGRTATLSFWAKADAAKNMAVEFYQSFGSGGSPSPVNTGIGVTTCALTTNWQKFTITVAVPSIAGKTIGTTGDDSFALNLWFDAGSNYNARTNSLGQQSGTFDIAQMQLEDGAVATSFEIRPPAIEQMLCYRFYRKLANVARTSLPMGMCFSTTSVLCTPAFAVDMRAAPSVTLNGTWRALMNGSSNPVSSFSVSEVSTQTCTITATIAGGTVGQAAIIQGNDGQGAAANVEFNAEL